MSKLILLAFLLTTVQAQDLASFLEPLQSHPSLLAAKANLSAAERNLNAAFDPVSAELSGSYLRFDTEDIDTDPQTPGQQGLPVNGGALGLGVTLRPFPFGSVADLVTQRDLELERARLEFRSTLAGLEVEALEAALNVRLAQEGLSLAQNAQVLSKQALDATQIRFELGAANERELREAQAGSLEAQTQVEDAEARLALAKASLESLVGGLSVPAEALELSAEGISAEDISAEGTSVGVLSAELAVAGAELAYRAASRDLYPVVSAGYSWTLDDNSSLGVSLESRTLQPSLNYSYEDPVQTQGGINGTFSIGLNASISPGSFEQLKGLEEELAGARVALVAAQEEAALQVAALTSQVTEAQRAVELESVHFENAQATLAETQQREELGLSIPLETQEAVLELSQAALELARARQTLLGAVAASYELYAQPISTYQAEVN